MAKAGRKPLPKDVKRTQFRPPYLNERERRLIIRAADFDGAATVSQWVRETLVAAAERSAAQRMLSV